MNIYSVFIITLPGDSWEWEVEPGGGDPGSVKVFRQGSEGDTSDFLLGTFSSEERAEAALAGYLAEYVLGEGDDSVFGPREPIAGVTLWKTVLDETDDLEGEFVRWMRGSEDEIPEYPYK